MPVADHKGLLRDPVDIVSLLRQQLKSPTDQRRLIRLPGRSVRSYDPLKISQDSCMAKDFFRHFLRLGRNDVEFFPLLVKIPEHLFNAIIKRRHINALCLIKLPVIDDSPVCIFLIKVIEILERLEQGRADKLLELLPALSLDPEFPQGISDRIHNAEFRLCQGPVQIKKDISVVRHDSAGPFQSLSKILIPPPLFFPGKMYLAKLLGIILITEFLVRKLLAGDVKDMPVHFIIAVEIAALAGNPIYPAAENILHQKGCDRTLAAGFMRRIVLSAQPGRTGIFTPDIGERVIKIQRRVDPRVFISDCRYICVLVSIKIISHI